MTDRYIRYIGGNFSSHGRAAEAARAGLPESSSSTAPGKAAGETPGKSSSCDAASTAPSGKAGDASTAALVSASTYLDFVRAYKPSALKVPGMASAADAGDDDETPSPVDVKRITRALSIEGEEHTGRLPRWVPNLAAAAGLVLALGASGWYFAAGPRTQPAPKVAETPAAVLSAKVKQRLAVRHTPVEVLLGLAAAEHQVNRRQHMRLVRVRKGDTFMSVLQRAGVPLREARAALTTLSGVFNVRNIRPGNRIRISFGIDGIESQRFQAVSFDSSFDRTIQIQRQAGGAFAASQTRKDLTMRLVRRNGEITSSLFQAGLSAGVPASRMIRLIHLFSFQVDFQRDIKKGDKFEILYRIHKDHNGRVVRHGAVIYAALVIKGQKIPVYRYIGEDGEPVYLNESGESNRRALMRTPIDGARLTSGFGFRRHPILGYSKLHTGVDFGAPRGTPIYAAGDGTIVKQGWFGGYGRYIRVRHNREYSTAYAHMSRFAKGMFEGKRVKQGQVIGYVGSTGRSTGPHLHYEVLRFNKQTNPMKLALPAFRKLTGDDLQAFLRFRTRVDQQYVALKKNGGAGRLIQVKAERPGACAGANAGLVRGASNAGDLRPCPATAGTAQ